MPSSLSARARQAYELTPGEPSSLLNLADCQLLLGRRERATELYESTVQLIDEEGLARHWDVRLIRAQALAQLGRTQEAVADVDEALRQSGQSAYASYSAALVYALVGERSSALVNAKRALDQGLSPRWFSLAWFEDLRSDSEFQAMLGAAAG